MCSVVSIRLFERQSKFSGTLSTKTSIMSERKKPFSMADAFSSTPNKKAKPSTPLKGIAPTTPVHHTPVRQPSLGIAHNGAHPALFSPGRDRKYSKEQESTFNDPIHGNITMDGLCLKIIDTKEFQRLRKLMQLGTCSYVYYGATHTRFEHSIGVSHFAGKVARNLQQAQPNLNITEEDILCVKVAGLCHDLGHGPFSHVFDGVFIPRVDPHTTWRHEDGSVQMLQFLLKKNKIEHDLCPQDVLFIEEIIAGTKEKERRGRGREKFYLYDIVNNSRSGLDVDKLDYFMRDMRYTNASSSTCNFQRFIELGRVYNAAPIEAAQNSGTSGSEEHYMICYPEKMVKEALDVFAVRFRLHQNIYTHKSVKKVEFMITDALVHANEVVRIPGSRTAQRPDGLYKMSECVQDPEALSNLNDQVLTVIELSSDPRLQKSQQLLRKVQNREFYTCLGKSTYTRYSKLFRATDTQIEDMIILCSEKICAAQQDKAQRGALSGPLATSLALSSTAPGTTATAASAWGTSFFSSNTTSGVQTDMDTSAEDPFAGISSTPDKYIQSQDSYIGDSYNYLDTDNECSRDAFSITTASSRVYKPLERGDIIVDKMHIHYGKKNQNPVDHMRFYPKGANPATHVAQQVDENIYQTLLPRTFEELAVRVFCRDPRKESIAAKAFKMFCNTENTHQPFPSQSQADDLDLDFQDEELL